MKGIECAFEGKIGSDPQIRTSQRGQDWLSLSVVVGENEDAQWISVAYFRDPTEIFGSLSNGANVYVEGKLKLRTWVDGRGETRTGISVSASHLQPLYLIGQKKPKTTKTAKRAAEKPAEQSLFTGPEAKPNGAKYDKPFNDEIPF